jgi:hypothetical protein
VTDLQWHVPQSDTLAVVCWPPQGLFNGTGGCRAAAASEMLGVAGRGDTSTAACERLGPCLSGNGLGAGFQY